MRHLDKLREQRGEMLPTQEWKIKMEMRGIAALNGVSVNVNCKCKGQPS